MLSEDESLFRDSVADLAAVGGPPACTARWSAAGRIDPTLATAKFFEAGLMGIEVPERHGPAAKGSLAMVTIAVEEISKVDAAAAILVDVQNTLVNYPIRTYGNDHIKATYLPRLTGGTVGAYALSEPSSGSDAFGLQTTSRAAWRCPGGSSRAERCGSRTGPRHRSTSFLQR